jgi:hypothetical protein
MGFGVCSFLASRVLNISGANTIKPGVGDKTLKASLLAELGQLGLAQAFTPFYQLLGYFRDNSVI